MKGTCAERQADLDLAGNFTDADIDPKLLNGGDLPPLHGEADLTLKDGVELVRSGGRSLRGHSGTIRTLSVVVGSKRRAFRWPGRSPSLTTACSTPTSR